MLCDIVVSISKYAMYHCFPILHFRLQNFRLLEPLNANISKILFWHLASFELSLFNYQYFILCLICTWCYPSILRLLNEYPVAICWAPGETRNITKTMKQTDSGGVTLSRTLKEMVDISPRLWNLGLNCLLNWLCARQCTATAEHTSCNK